VARIVHVVEALGGGVLSVLSSLVNAQVRDQHEVTLIGSTARADIPDTWRDMISPAVQFINVPMVREIRPAADASATWTIRRLLRQLRPDVLHLHSSKAGGLGRLAALGLGLKVIYQPHGLAYLRRDVDPRKRWLFARLEKWLALLGGTVLACSEGERQALRSIVADHRIDLVCNGIPMLELPTRQTNPSTLPRIGTCSRVCPQKNPPFFAEVAQSLAGEAVFVWIGDGDKEDKTVLQAANVEITGWRTRTQCLDEMSRLDLYIQTSIWEGMPIAVIEAMALGLPVVATDILGNRDLIEGSAAGTLVSSPEDMVAAIRRILGDSVLASRMSAAGAHVAREQFSDVAMVKGHYRVYGLASA